MQTRIWLRALVWLLLGAFTLAARPAHAEEALPAKDWSLTDNPAVQPRPDKSLLGVVASDLKLNLWSGSDDRTVRVPLAPGEWSFLKDLQPYAALSPSSARSLTDATLSGPSREAADDPWKGLGVGAGVNWRLSDRVDLFGQYLFMNLPGGNAPAGGSPIMRRDVETPGLKGGFSIHF
jgi:hypothetical protein